MRKTLWWLLPVALLFSACNREAPPVVAPPTPVNPTVKVDKSKEDAAFYVSKGDAERANGNTESARVFYNEALKLYPSKEIRAKLSSLPKSSTIDKYGPESDKVPSVDAYLANADDYMKHRAENERLNRARIAAEEKARRDARKTQDVKEAAAHVEEGRRDEAAKIGREIGRRQLHDDWSKP